MRRGYFVYFVLLWPSFLLGCGSSGWSLPAQPGWLLLDRDLKTLDLRSGRVSTLMPKVQLLLNQAAPDLKPLWFVPSPRGRYLACRMNGGTLWIVDLVEHSCRMAPRFSRNYLDPGEVSWQADESSFAYLGYLSLRNPANDRTQSSAVVLSFSLDQWQWGEAHGIGLIDIPYGHSAMTNQAWWDKTTLLFSSAGRVKAYHWDTQKTEDLGKGFGPVALPDRRYVCNSDVHWCVLRNGDQEKSLSDGHGHCIRETPVLSPDGRYLLYVNLNFVSIWGFAGLSYTAAVYDLTEGQFHPLLRSRQLSYDQQRCINWGSWIANEDPAASR